TRGISPALLWLYLPRLQPVPHADCPPASGNRATLGRGAQSAAGTPAGIRIAGNTRLGTQGPPVSRGTFRRRKAARGHWPGSREGARLLLRRRADQRPRLGPRRASDRAVTVGRARTRRDGARGLARRAIGAVGRSSLAPRG